MGSSRPAWPVSRCAGLGEGQIRKIQSVEFSTRVGREEAIAVNRSGSWLLARVCVRARHANSDDELGAAAGSFSQLQTQFSVRQHLISKKKKTKKKKQ